MFNRKLQLKLALIKKDMTERELAKRLRVTPEYIIQVVGGIRELSYDRQVKTAKILGVPRAILFKQTN